MLASSARKNKFKVPVQRDEVERDWVPRGYSCDLFVDPPGKVCCPAAAAAAEGGPACACASPTAACLPACLLPVCASVASPPTTQHNTTPARPHRPTLNTLLQECRDFVHREDELVAVVEGCMEFTVGGDRCVLQPGDELAIPAGAPGAAAGVGGRRRGGRR